MAFGFIGKAFKGIKKVAKKIGKGIKKIGKKLLGAIGKIGPLGQLALMFIGIPPVISNFFGSIGGAIGGFVSRVAPNVAKAFNTIKGVAQGAYNTITEGIGNGIDRVMNFTKGKGFTLTEGRTSIFNRPPSTPDITPTKAALDPKLDVDVPIEKIEPNLDLDLKPNKPVLDTETFEITGGNMVDSGTVVDSVVGEAKPSLLDRGKDFVSEQFDTFKETVSDPGKLAGEAVKGGVMSGISSKVAMDIAGDPPTQKVMHSQLSDFMMTPTTPQRLLDSTTWSDISNSYQKAGAFGGAATGDLMSSYFNQNFANDTQYQQDMRRLGAFTL